MQPTIEQAVARLISTVSNGKTHKDYKRVVDLAAEYKQLITGEGIKELLRQIIRREDAESFKQRLDITETVLPAISEKIMSPFSKIGRMDNVTKSISFDSDANNKKGDLMDSVLSDFWGDDSIDSYMDTRFVELSFCDPNSYIMVEFDSFNPDTDKANPFPVEVMSKDVLDVSYTNNTLDWIVFRRPTVRQVEENGRKVHKKDFKYFIYLHNFQVQIVKLDEKTHVPNTKIPVDENGSVPSVFNIKVDEKNKFQVTIFEQKSGMVQGVRVGYKRDLSTDGRTCVSPLHPAVNRMKKTLKTGSELDLTMTLHAFPQKYQYVKECTGEETQRCRKGFTENGDKCGVCQGSGFQIHTSSLDAILLPLPRDPATMHDLSKLTHYSSPDINLAKFQEEYGRRLEADAIKDVFSSDTFNRSSVVNTATEVVIEMQSVYDTLFPFAKKYSAVYRKLVMLSAVFTDNEVGLIVTHSFPKDFKLKTLEVLLRDLEQAGKSSAPAFVKTEIANDIAEKIWQDNPAMLRVFKVKNEHMPFSGKDSDEIIYIQSVGKAAENDVILWANFEAIFKELEIEQRDSKTENDFYSLPYKQRVILVSKKVDQFKERIDSQNQTAISFGQVELED